MHVAALYMLGLWLCLFSPTTAGPPKNSLTLTGGIAFAKELQHPEPSDIKVFLLLQGGQRRRAFVTGNASFAFQHVPLGQHSVEASCIGYIIPSVLVNAATSDQISLAYTEFPEYTLPTPLILRAVRVDYFDRSQGIDVLAFLKSPMGLLAAFMAFAMFLSPYLKVDPEELENYQKEIKEAKDKKASSAENARLMAASASTGNTASSTSRLGGGPSSARQRTKR